MTAASNNSAPAKDWILSRPHNDCLPRYRSNTATCGGHHVTEPRSRASVATLRRGQTAPTGQINPLTGQMGPASSGSLGTRR